MRDAIQQYLANGGKRFILPGNPLVELSNKDDNTPWLRGINGSTFNIRGWRVNNGNPILARELGLEKTNYDHSMHNRNTERLFLPLGSFFCDPVLMAKSELPSPDGNGTMIDMPLIGKGSQITGVVTLNVDRYGWHYLSSYVRDQYFESIVRS